MGIKSVYLIRNADDGTFLTKFRTVRGHLNKCVFNNEHGARIVIKDQLNKHWLMSKYNWEVVIVGTEWQSPNYKGNDIQ